jgi:hypothetical protein
VVGGVVHYTRWGAAIVMCTVLGTSRALQLTRCCLEGGELSAGWNQVLRSCLTPLLPLVAWTEPQQWQLWPLQVSGRNFKKYEALVQGRLGWPTSVVVN